MEGITSRLKNQPKYQIGQAVVVAVKTKHEPTGEEFSNSIKAYISTIKASGTSEKDTYEYGVTVDMPGCYHSGKSPFKYLYEDEIVAL